MNFLDHFAESKHIKNIMKSQTCKYVEVLRKFAPNMGSDTSMEYSGLKSKQFTCLYKHVHVVYTTGQINIQR